MTQMEESRLGRLTEAVAGLPSGNKLIAALEEATNNAAVPIDIITAVVTEARASNSVATAPTPARADLSQASSLIPQLQFLTPR